MAAERDAHLVNLAELFFHSVSVSLPPSAVVSDMVGDDCSHSDDTRQVKYGIMNPGPGVRASRLSGLNPRRIAVRLPSRLQLCCPPAILRPAPCAKAKSGCEGMFASTGRPFVRSRCQICDRPICRRCQQTQAPRTPFLQIMLKTSPGLAIAPGSSVSHIATSTP